MNLRTKSAAAAFTVFLVSSGSSQPVRGDAVDKLRPEQLAATHQAIAALRSTWHPVPRRNPYSEVRANLHVHSALSHDSRGRIEDIIAAARTVGTHVLLFTEHPSDQFDIYEAGHQGINDGILMIPGAETRGLLVFPDRSLRGLDGGSVQEFVDLIGSRGGLTFLSHLEERMDWDLRGLTGTEIYNTHANFKEERNLNAALRNPLWLLQTAELFRKYPQETFSALHTYPASYLRRWDELCERYPLTGIAANDSHQNIGITAHRTASNKVRIEDALGKTLMEVDAGLLPSSLLSGPNVPGDAILFRLYLDDYEYSLRHVGTHLLMKEFSKRGVWEALESGRAFVGFDWLADSTGFDFAAVADKQRFEMGSRLVLKPGMTLEAAAPLPVRWRLLRQGQIAGEGKGRAFQTMIDQPGNYRIEAWLEIAGKEMIWILSNPIYVRLQMSR